MFHVILFLFLIYFIAAWFHWLKWILLIYLICLFINWHPFDWLTEKDKESFFYILREEKKEIFIGLISLFFVILSFLLEILGVIYVFLLPFFKQTYQESKNFIYRLKNINYIQLFVLYLIPLILLGAALWYRQDESWELALKRISPELEEFIKFSLFSVFVGIICFFLFYDNTKNNVSSRVFSAIYGAPKPPNRKEHWFLRFCFWLHPETYVIAKILNLVFLYLFFVHVTFYFYLGFYTFKGVYF